MNSLFEIGAPVATMSAAVMTAANLGPRVTGWGFVVFTFGSLAWCGVALASGQQNLLLTNAFLTLVNAIGTWRWFRRVARHEDGARSPEITSEQAPAPTLVAVSKLVGQKVLDANDAAIGTIIGLMAEFASGKMSCAVVGTGGVGGVGERLVAVDWADLSSDGANLKTTLSKEALEAKPTVYPIDWPVAAT